VPFYLADQFNWAKTPISTNAEPITCTSTVWNNFGNVSYNKTLLFSVFKQRCTNLTFEAGSALKENLKGGRQSKK